MSHSPVHNFQQVNDALKDLRDRVEKLEGSKGSAAPASKSTNSVQDAVARARAKA